MLKKYVWKTFQQPKPVQKHRNIEQYHICIMQTWSFTARHIPFAIHQCDLLLTWPCFTKENFSALIWSRISHQLKAPSCHQPHLSNHKQHCSRNNLTLNSKSKTFYPKHTWTLYIIPFHEVLHPWQCEIPVFFATEQNLWQIEEGPSLTTFCSPPLNSHQKRSTW